MKEEIGQRSRLGRDTELGQYDKALWIELACNWPRQRCVGLTASLFEWAP